MKKNIFLTLLLLSLFGFTYYLEEVEKPATSQSQTKIKKLFKNLEQIKSLEFEQYELQFKGENWSAVNSSQPISQPFVEEFISILKGLTIIQEVAPSQESESFLKYKKSLNINASTGTFSLFLGDVSEISGHFYLKLNGKLYSVKDSTFLQSVHSNELDLNIKKYLRIKRFFDSTVEQISEKRLLLPYLKQDFLSARLDSRRNRWYSLDFKMNQTSPAAPVGTKYKDLRGLYRQAMSKLILTKVKPNAFEKDLSELESEITLLTSTGEVRMKLFKAFKGEYGHFVTLSDNKSIFEVKEQGSELFYFPYQYFWLKKFQLPSSIYNSSGFEFSLSLDQKRFYKFEVEDVESFSFAVLDKRVESFDKNYFNFVFNLIFNTNSFTEADFINQNIKLSDFLNQEFVLSVRLFSKTFHIKLGDYDIEVLDEDLALSYIFSKRNAQVKSINLQRIFTLGSE